MRLSDFFNEARSRLGRNAGEIHGAAVSALEVFRQIEGDRSSDRHRPGHRRGGPVPIASRLPQSTRLEKVGCPVVVTALLASAPIAENSVLVRAYSRDEGCMRGPSDCGVNSYDALRVVALLEKAADIGNAQTQA